jgi:LuxR family maltose regulon positive regulatory protein
MGPGSPYPYKHPIISRPRPLSILRAGLGRRLIIIAAPSGYGKTTLLTDFISQLKCKACWIDLAADDRAFRHFLGTIRQAFREQAKAKLPLSRRSVVDNQVVESWGFRIGRLLSGADAEQQLVVVVDNVHWVCRSKRGLAFLGSLMRAMPQGVTSILSGDQTPEFGLADFMAQGELLALGPQDLALDTQELRDLAYRQASLVLDKARVNGIMRVTKGWLAGVLLSGMLEDVQNHGDAAWRSPRVKAYLEAAVMPQYPCKMARLMMDTAVLPFVSIDACRKILSMQINEKILRDLAESCLFLNPSRGGQDRFEYHPQFRDFLIWRLESSNPARARRLRQRAIQVLRDAGDVEHLVGSLLESGDRDGALEILSDSAEEMAYSGRSWVLEKWSAEMQKACVRSPHIHLLLAIGFAVSGWYDKARQEVRMALDAQDDESELKNSALYEIVQASLASGEGNWDAVLKLATKVKQLAEPGEERKPLIVANLFIARALAAGWGEYEKAEAALMAALALMEEPMPLYALAIALFQGARNLQEQGRWGEARALWRKNSYLVEEKLLPILPYGMHAFLAADDYHRGDYESALEHFRKAIRIAREQGSVGEADVLLGFASLLIDLRLSGQAHERILQAIALAQEHEDRDQELRGRLLRANLLRLQGEPAQTEACLEKIPPSARKFQIGKDYRIQQAGLLILKDPQHAARNCQQLLQEEGLDISRETKVLTFLTKAQLLCGAIGEASPTLERLLHLVGMRGSTQLLAGELAYDDALLSFVQQAGGESYALQDLMRRLETMRVLRLRMGGAEEPGSPSTSDLDISALGRVQASMDGIKIEDLKPLALHILIYLADRKAEARDVFQEQFWPGVPADRQSERLHVMVSGLRRRLGRDAIEFDGLVYRINSNVRIHYDVEEFERAAKVALALHPGDPYRMKALARAGSIYQGDFLPRLDSAWASARRQELRRLLVDLLVEHAREALVLKHPREALRSLRRALEIEDLREDVNSLYLEALGLLGRKGEVIAHFARYRRRLSSDLGITPEDAVQEVYNRLIGSGLGGMTS